MISNVRTIALALCGVVVATVLSSAQLPLPDGQPSDPALRFVVASIRPYADTGPARFRIQPAGHVDISGASVRLLLRNAFRVQDDRLIGVPGWADTDRYSILAKAPDGTSVRGVPTMLANLMADRFSLTTHTETRESQTFDLVRADDKRRLGAALTPTSQECSATIATGGSAPARAAVEEAPCGALQTAAGMARATGVRLTRLAQLLSQLTGRPVNDTTGLDGLYDFTLKFNPSLSADAIGDSNDPHLFTALQEQLGLRLSSQRRMVQVIVIDRLERPTAD
jgi:bla regulator protein blaR1